MAHPTSPIENRTPYLKCQRFYFVANITVVVDVDPYAKAIVEELGLAVSSQAQSVNNLPLETYDLIVTLCSDEDICPLLPASVKDRVLHVPFGDPSQKVNQLAADDLIAHYRDVRDQLDAFCKTLDQTLIKQSTKN